MELIVDFPQQSERCRHSRRRSRFVTFDTEVEIKFVENLSLRSDLKSSLWSSRKELKSYKYHFALSVKEMKKCTAKGVYPRNIDADDFVGLENFVTDTSHLEVQARRRATRKAVMMEQHRQDKLGIYDISAFAAVSAKESEWARKRAHFFGALHKA